MSGRGHMDVDNFCVDVYTVISSVVKMVGRLAV